MPRQIRYTRAIGTFLTIVLIGGVVAMVLPVSFERKFTLFAVVAVVAIVVFVYSHVRDQKLKDEQQAELFMREAIPPAKPKDPS